LACIQLFYIIDPTGESTPEVLQVVSDALGTHVYGQISSKLRAGNVLEVKQALQERGALKRSYWFCALSVNQHSNICGSFAPGSSDAQNTDTVTGKLYALCQCRTTKHFNDSAEYCEINKFDAMLEGMRRQHGNAFRLVVAVDPTFDLFKRIWCIAEIVKSRRLRIHIDLKFEAEDTLRNRLVLRERDQLRVQDCRATRQDDVNEVLRTIGDDDDQRNFNEFLQDLIFDESHGLFAQYQRRTGDSSTALAEVGHVFFQLLGAAPH
jgi:hypothetical protein